MNVEPALQASARLGGHIVQGHVDGLGEVAEIREEGFARVVRIAAPRQTSCAMWSRRVRSRSTGCR